MFYKQFYSVLLRVFGTLLQVVKFGWERGPADFIATSYEFTFTSGTRGADLAALGESISIAEIRVGKANEDNLAHLHVILVRMTKRQIVFLVVSVCVVLLAVRL